MSDLLEDNIEEEEDQIETIPKRRKTDALDESQLIVYNTVCHDRFQRIEHNQELQMPILQDINAKVNNGYDKDIKAIHNKVDIIQEHTDKTIEEFKVENEKEHKNLNDGQKGIQKSLNRLILSIIIASITVMGGIIATILTGFFGLLS